MKICFLIMLFLLEVVMNFCLTYCILFIGFLVNLAFIKLVAVIMGSVSGDSREEGMIKKFLFLTF